MLGLDLLFWCEGSWVWWVMMGDTGPLMKPTGPDTSPGTGGYWAHEE